MISPLINECLTLRSTALTLTTNGQDLGDEIDVRSISKIFLYIDVDINSSNNVRIKVLGKLYSSVSSNEYTVCSVGTPSSGAAACDYYYIELNADEDQKVCIPIDVAGYVTVQLQAYVGTAGATAADIESAYITADVERVRS